MNSCREKTVNAKATRLNYVPSIAELRMSRLRHPRGTLIAMILLATVFLLFGVVASAIQPGDAAQPEAMTGMLTSLARWAAASSEAMGWIR